MLVNTNLNNLHFLQQYPDALMLRLAIALARFISQDPNSPTTSRPNSPAPRKSSLKSKPSWRSASVHADNRTQGFKCPFTATRALTEATKKEIDAYTSSEEIRSSPSTDRINEEKEIVSGRDFSVLHRHSLAFGLEDHKTAEIDEVIPETERDGRIEEAKPEIQTVEDIEEVSLTSPKDPPTSPESERKRTTMKPIRKTSCTVALDVYRRRGSLIPVRPRQNSLSVIYGDKLSLMKEKFGTPEKAMHFFGRCFVKFFSNYG